MKKSIFVLAALAALFSCSKENNPTDNYTAETFSVELTASAPSVNNGNGVAPANAMTKTTLVDGENAKLVYWSKGDAIKVLFFPDHDNSNTFNGPGCEFQSYFETEISENAYFKTNSWSWGFGSDVVSNRLMENGIAVYPSTAEATSNKTVSGSGSANNTELSFTLPDAQKAINGNIESGLNFSYAMVGRDGFKSVVDNKSAMNLKFNNACALIQLTMPSEFEKEVTSITISSNNEVALTGKGNVDMNYYKDEILSPFHVTPEVTETSHTVTLAKADGSALEAGATYFAVVWPGEHEGLTISFNAADGTVATLTTKTVKLKAAVVKPYNILSTLDFVSAQRDYKYYYANGEMGDDPNPAGTSVVGVIIYHGDPKSQFSDSELPPDYNHGLAVSVKTYSTKWHTSQPSSTNSKLKVTNTYSLPDYDLGGYTVKQLWVSEGYNLNLYNASNYDTLNGNTSGWYHGTPVEWKYICKHLSEINALLQQVPGAQQINPAKNSEYILPLHYMKAKNHIFYINGGSPAYKSYDFDFTSNNQNARPIFAF